MLNSEVYGQRPPITPEAGEKRLLFIPEILPIVYSRAKNGKTIQVDNTDAEGRLILADAVSH